MAAAVKQRSAYLMRTRPEDGPFKRYTPDEWVKKGKGNLFPEERPKKLTVRRMSRIDDSDDDEDEVNEEEPQPVVKNKTMPQRGRATRSRGTRGRK